MNEYRDYCGRGLRIGIYADWQQTGAKRKSVKKARRGQAKHKWIALIIICLPLMLVVAWSSFQ